ncbi:transmembrane protein 192 isoform X2 [Austrofundulus limnaeus]|uniref:Transmembrane protein 192 n=1 Tax=Austrofundulus limnaeus TaxID=52670 RepID=A0A2I4C821_AUSLI|nr:PREDICTED: transmembrane protein 192 isoform X2 [Austrofundulus limnaeus]
MDSKGPSLRPAGPSGDITQSTEEDSLVDGPLISADALHSAIRREFQPVPTTCPAGLLALLHVLYVVLSTCVALLCVLKFGQEEVCVNILDGVQGDSVIVFGKVFLWVLMLSLSIWMQHHHSRVRSRGYLQFYRQTRWLKQVPFTVHSIGNTLVLSLLAMKLPQNIHIYLLLSILGLELLVAASFLICYTVKVVQFNKERAAPDVSQEDLSHTNSVTASPAETGFRGPTNLEEVVEKQADLIEYLKQHNTLLSKRLLNLTAQH